MTVRQLASRVFLVVLVALLVGLGAFVFSTAQDERFAATTQIRLGASAPELNALGFPFAFDEADRRAVNALLQVRSFDVARRTAAGLGGRGYTADLVAEQVTVGAERGGDVFTIRATAENPADAGFLAERYRQSFAELTRATVGARARRARDAVSAALDDLPRDPGLGGRADFLRRQRNALDILVETGGVYEVVLPTRAATRPFSPTTNRNVLFGLLFGAILGVGLVALRGAVRSGPAR